MPYFIPLLKDVAPVSAFLPDLPWEFEDTLTPMPDTGFDLQDPQRKKFFSGGRGEI